MTSAVLPAGAAGYSSSAAAAFRPRAGAFLAARFVVGARLAVDLVAVVRLVVDFFAAICLVYGLGIRRGARIIVSGSIHHGAQVVQGDAAVELQHRPLDHLLELRGVERSGAGQREQMSPGFRGESATFVRSQYANS